MRYLLSDTLAETINQQTASSVAEAIGRGLEPQLAVVLVGEDPASLRYISLKSRAARSVGIILSLYQLEADSPLAAVKESIAYLDGDEDMNGIILQLPLPASFSSVQTDELIHLVSAQKDVDGLRGDWRKLTYSQTSLSSLLTPQPFALPPMVGAVLSLLDHYDIDLSGKKIVLVGEGRLVGGPLLAFFEGLGLDVVAVTEESDGILDLTRQADILISGTGQENLITYQWVKEGAVVIDCAADVHEDSVSQVASALAPSRGGVGPLTVAWLLHNTVQAALQNRRMDG